MKLKYIAFLLFSFLYIIPSIAQLGSTHYIPPLHARLTGDPSQEIGSAFIYLSTPFGTAPVNITITTGDGTVIPNGNQTIINGAPVSVDVTQYMGVTVNQLNTPLSNKGLIVSGTELFYISLRLQSQSGNHSGYITAKGEDAFGTRFRVGSSEQNNTSPNHSFFTSFMAVEDNTVVTISDYDTGIVFEPVVTDDTLTINLNAGESYTISGYTDVLIDGNNAGFIGALIETNDSDHPIVVNTGNVNGNEPNSPPNNGSDIMVDQIVQEELVGFEYLLVRGNGNPLLERVLVIATQDNTDIFVNGNVTPEVSLNAGEYSFISNDALYLPNDINETHRNMYISTNDENKSLYVYQYIGGSNDNSPNSPFPDATPGMSFIPPLSCFFQNSVDLIPDVDEVSPLFGGYVGNIAITSFIGNTVNVNGLPLDPTTALQNPGTIEWETYNVGSLNGNVIITSDGPIAVGLVAANSAAGFGGYYSGFAVIPEDSQTEVCTGNGTINLFDRIDGNPPTGGIWSPPLDSGTDIFDPTTDPISNPTLAYTYTAMGFCEEVDITVTVTLIETPVIDPIADIDACETFTLPDPTTITGSFLNNPQYFTDPQSNPTTTLIDWTIPITTTTTIYIYDENEADPEICTAEINFDVIINDFAIANAVPDQVVCDDPTNDGLEIFDLTTLEATVLGTQNPLSYTVTFHTTQTDATNGDNPITPPEAYQAGTSTIFARIENNLSDICFDTTPINLIVSLQPIANPVPDQITCDDSSNNGLEIFNLTNIETILLGTQNPLEYTITYHLNQISADNDTGAIVTPTAFNSTSAVIIVRIENTSNPNCFDTTEIVLTVDFLPEAVAPGDYGICDNTIDGDDTNGFTEFNLSTQDLVILNGQSTTDVTLTYHSSLIDAQTDTAPLPSLHTNATVNSQPIFARVENNNNPSCFTITTFDIVVHPLPIIINPLPLLTQCDVDNDGFAIFNLTQAEILISADFTNETFQYFDQANNIIADPIAYTNSIVNNETINVIVSTVNGCSRPTQMLLEVDTSQIPSNFLLEYTACDTDSDGVSVFDFSDATAQVLGLFPAGQLLTVTYYETLQEAQSEVSAIPDISNYTNNIALTDVNGVQGVWVRVDGDTANDCIGLGIHVQLTVLPNPLLNTDVDDITICNDTPIAAIFDLTSKDIEITGGNPDYAVSYYASLADYLAVPPIPIPNPTIYPNASEPQTIYYSAVNTVTGCITFDDANLSFQLFVNENPTTVTPTDLLVCDLDGLDDGFTLMDLTVKNAEITGGFDPDVSISYH
ncbi:IgGFc-binding protein, partial [Dokdonia sp.]